MRRFRNRDEDVVAVTPEEALVDVRQEMLDWGYPQAANVSPVDPAGALLVAELANYAAKHRNDYGPKVRAFAAAAMLPGVESGWSKDEDDNDVFVLYAPGVGEVRAHDPFGELRRALKCWRYKPRTWPHEWTGELAQPFILDVLEEPALRRYRETLTTTHPQTTGHALGRAARGLKRAKTRRNPGDGRRRRRTRPMTKPTPPPKHGMIRLYRGETSAFDQPSRAAPSWMVEDPEHEAVSRAAGRWFSASVGEAVYYANRFGDEDSVITYVDVPARDLDRHRASNAAMEPVYDEEAGEWTEPKHFTAGGREGRLAREREFFVTPEVAARRKVLVPQPSPGEEVDPASFESPRKNPKPLTYLVERFSDLVSAKGKKPKKLVEKGRFVVTEERGTPDRYGELTKDVLRLKVDGKYVGAVEGQHGISPSGQEVFTESRVYVRHAHRGKGYTASLYSLLLDEGFVIVSDYIAHSPPMRRVWLALAKEYFVFSNAANLVARKGPQEFLRVAPGGTVDDPLLDEVLYAVKADDEQSALQKVRAVYMSVVDTHGRVEDEFRRRNPSDPARVRLNPALYERALEQALAKYKGRMSSTTLAWADHLYETSGGDYAGAVERTPPKVVEETVEEFVEREGARQRAERVKNIHPTPHRAEDWWSGPLDRDLYESLLELAKKKYGQLTHKAVWWARHEYLRKGGRLVGGYQPSKTRGPR